MTAKIESAEEFAERYFGESSYRLMAHGARLRQMIEARDEQIRAEAEAKWKEPSLASSTFDAGIIEGYRQALDIAEDSHITSEVLARLRAEIERRGHNTEGGAE